MANSAPMGRIAPASKPRTGNIPHFDPVALHGEAINACAMATYYTRKGVPVPSAGTPTRHGLPPSFGDGVGRFQTCSEGAIHG